MTYLGRVGGGAGPWLAASVLKEGRSVLYVTADSKQAARALDDLTAFSPDRPPRSFPGPEVGPYATVRPDRVLSRMRAAVLASLVTQRPSAIVTTASGWIRRTVPPPVLARAISQVVLDQQLAPAELSSTLEHSGYERVSLVEDPASFAIRGDIIDVWSPGDDTPARIELDFERVQRIRPFDPKSQRSSGEPLEALQLLPAREAIVTPESALRAEAVMRDLCDAQNLPTSRTRLLLEDVRSGRAFFSGQALLPAHHQLSPLSAHLPDDAVLIFEQGDRIYQRVQELLSEAREAHDRMEQEPRFPVGAHYLEGQALADSLNDFSVASLQSGTVFFGENSGFGAIEGPSTTLFSLGTFSQDELARKLALARKDRGGDLSPLWEALEFERENHHEIILSARTETQADRLAQLGVHRGFPMKRREAALLEKHHAVSKGDVQLVVSSLMRGFASETERLFLLTEEEIFGQRVHRQKRSAAGALRDALDDLRLLSVGDYVVHQEHGIGKYLGLEHRQVAGVTVDLIAIEYLGGDKLFLPVYRLSQVQRYSGAESSPRLDKLGGQTFARTKKQATARVRQMADQLLSLYALRRHVKRPPLAVHSDDYAAFAAEFPYEETPDQAAAISDVLSDLSQDHVMDRLICGDVGFGKTEVALRAAFLSVLAGRQVALLCPTTVLAEQHYRTFSSRLSRAGAEVRVVSRFQSRKQVTQTLADLKAGRVDVVVGTHRLLSKDVYFKNLGLLVVDEEQRFGVTHKERIKELRRNIDVLTLTATPIPRTLSLSMSGVRDMSVIMTPPVDRRSIRTFIARMSPELIVDALRHEVERAGQVFYVYNRVGGIVERAALIRKLLPDLRVGVGHGQMSERELEKTMLGFVKGDFDVLVATTIIESGLDIPRANTMLVERADQFGLAQLYQLRGRVGRSSERAYCYLLLPPDVPASNEAMKRLEALERYTELGSGFHVATLDMELRGAGEILGQDQSGLLPRIGFDLFSRMLEQASAELAGVEYDEEVDPELSIDLEALLPESYISEVGLRLSLYKRFALAKSEEEVLSLSEEMEDRFGAPPPEARRYAEVMRLKTHLRELRALGCNATRRSVTLHLREDTPLSAKQLAPWLAGKMNHYSLTPDGRLTRRAGAEESFDHGLAHARRMLSELSSIRK